MENSESSDDSEDEEDFSPKNKFLAAVNGDAQKENKHSYDLMTRFEQQQKVSFFKEQKKQFPMFQYTEEKTRVRILF